MEIVFVNVKITRKVRMRVAERVRLGKCLVCDSDAVKRQLCQQHYDAWFYAQRLIPTKLGKVRFNNDLRKKGFLVAAYEVREYKSASPIIELAKKHA